MTITYSPEAPWEIPAKPTLTQRLTNITHSTLGKAVEAGYLQDLSIDTVVQVSRLPEMTSARTRAGVPIPILRLSPAREVDRTATTDGGRPLEQRRTLYGAAAWASDEQLLAAANRWWPPSGRERVIAAGYLLVAVGGLTIALLRIDGAPITDPDGSGRIEYPATLVARVHDILAREIATDLADDLDPEGLQIAQTALATRSTTRGGGSIGLLDADLPPK